MYAHRFEAHTTSHPHLAVRVLWTSLIRETETNGCTRYCELVKSKIFGHRWGTAMKNNRGTKCAEQMGALDIINTRYYELVRSNIFGHRWRAEGTTEELQNEVCSKIVAGKGSKSHTRKVRRMSKWKHKDERIGCPSDDCGRHIFFYQSIYIVNSIFQTRCSTCVHVQVKPAAKQFHYVEDEWMNEWKSDFERNTSKERNESNAHYVSVYPRPKCVFRKSDVPAQRNFPLLIIAFLSKHKQIHIIVNNN